MDLLQLKYFCHAAATESFAQTAENFRVPASNISQCIRRLEQELGTPLFDRFPNRVKLNMQGKTFYRSIRQAMELIDLAVSEMVNTATPCIKIGHTQGRTFVVGALDNFIRQFPEIEVVTYKYDLNTSPQSFDIILSAEDMELDGFSSELVLRESMILIAPQGTLPETGRVPLEVLREQPFITSDAKRRMYHDTVNICKNLGFTPRIAFQLEYTKVIPRYVSQGLGVALLPLQSRPDNLENERLDIRVIPNYYRDLYMFCKKQRSQRPHIVRFCEMLKEVLVEAGKESPLYPPLLLR